MNLLKAAASVSAMTLLSRITGLVREMLLASFFGAGAVDGNIVSPTFGEIVKADSPRLVQLAVKYSF